jgi:hypothetical protein
VLLRSKPSFKYCGLSVILSNPSRFDKTRLLSAGGGHCFGEFCLRPEFNILQCDIRQLEETEPFLEGTKCILVLGEHAMHTLLPETHGNTLNEMRGSLFYYNGIPAIPSYLPQDCADIKSYEAQNNPLSKDFQVDVEDDEASESVESIKRYSRTHRKNFAFWLRADTRKAKYILQNGPPKPEYPEPIYVTYPTAELTCNILKGVKGSFLYFDIETDWEEQNIQCFSFSFDGHTIYNIPILDYNYKFAYESIYIYKIFQALAIAIRDNILVAHNGACFDFFLLCWKYRIPIYNVYDTMVAMHRCYPDIEKSLGHGVSLFTWEHFHKDEDSQGYYTKQQMMDRMKYCGKDVYTMFLVHMGIVKLQKQVVGLEHSINTANASIMPYLINTLTGIRVNQEKLKEIQNENDRLMTQYLRICDILIGPEGKKEIKERMSSKPKGFPNSSTQCCIYFHDLLGYPVVARSPQTGKPSLGKKAIFSLALRHDNPVLKVVTQFRILSKEYSSLKFNPWKGDRNTCFYTHKPKTFRQSSTGIFKENGSNVPKFGGNMQNIKKEMREVYEPDYIDI